MKATNKMTKLHFSFIIFPSCYVNVRQGVPIVWDTPYTDPPNQFGISVSSRLTLSLYYSYRQCKGLSLIYFLLFFADPLAVLMLLILSDKVRQDGKPYRLNPFDL